MTAKSAANGHASAVTRQVLEQAQQGDGSEQQQLAGQWTTIAQDQRLVAATGLSSAVNGTRLAGDAGLAEHVRRHHEPWLLDRRVLQVVVQVQIGDSVAQQQESYQVVEIEQDGEVLRCGDRGRDASLRHAVAVPGQREPAAARAPSGSLQVFSLGSRSVTSPVTGGPIKPRTYLGAPGTSSPRRHMRRHVARHISPRFRRLEPVRPARP